MTEFEPILLKKLTHNAEFFGKVIPIIKPKHFIEVGNQELFKLIKDYFSEYRQIPTLTELIAKVKGVSNAEIRNQIINSLQTINKTEEVANLDFMCAETVAWVKDAMYMESLLLGSDGLSKKDDNLKQKAKEIMEEMAKITIDSDLGLDFDDIDAMIEYYSERHLGIRTQHKELNKRIGAGFIPGTLSVILAASGVGKSLLMTDLISGMIKKKKNILLISLEMADKEIMKRVHANAMDLPINSLVDLSKTPGELKEIEKERKIIDKEQVLSAYRNLKMSGDCGKFFVKDYPSGAFSALMLEQLVESYRIEKGIEFDIVFVDYIGIMKSDILSPSAGLYSYIKSIAEEVRASAKKMNLPIVSASQLNRSAVGNVENADNSAVSDSMGTVMTADFMLFLLQNEEMKTAGNVFCKITKNRFTGRTDGWVMNVDYEHMKFIDAVVQNSNETMTNGEAMDIVGVGQTTQNIDDFSMVTAEQMQKMDEMAKEEIPAIFREDMEKIKEADKENKDPFANDADKIYAELGIL